MARKSRDAGTASRWHVKTAKAVLLVDHDAAMTRPAARFRRTALLLEPGNPDALQTLDLGLLGATQTLTKDDAVRP